MTRLLDTLIDWLMRPRVRRVRRWSFMVTVPVAVIVAHVFGVQQGALVIAARVAVAIAIAVVAVVQRDEGVLLAARGRVDVWLELTEPVAVQRPMHEPLYTTRLAVASDDPDRLVGLLLGHEPAAEPVRRSRARLLGALDGVGLVRDTAQPA